MDDKLTQMSLEELGDLGNDPDVPQENDEDEDVLANSPFPARRSGFRAQFLTFMLVLTAGEGQEQAQLAWEGGERPVQARQRPRALHGGALGEAIAGILLSLPLRFNHGR